MTILIKVLQLILCLSILVIVHEFGHYIAAKIFKTRVTKFYIFFHPKFSLMRVKRINGKLQWRFFAKNLDDSELVVDSEGKPILNEKKQKQYKPIDIDTLPEGDWRRYPDNTEFGIGWVPLGGYCAIAGMVDETQSAEDLASEPQPYEYRSKPAWQRLIIILGGVIMNVITAMVIYTGLLAHFGETYLPNKNVKYGITVDSLGYEMGLRNGDFILSVDNVEVDDFYAIPQAILLNRAETIQVLRDGETIDVEIPSSTIAKLMKVTKVTLISPRTPFIVGGFGDDSPAKESGIMVDDKIVKVDGMMTEYFDQFKEAVTEKRGQNIVVSVLRNGDNLDFPVKVSDEGMVGIYANNAGVFDFESIDYNIIQAIPAGCKQAFTQIGSYVKSLRLLFIPETKGYESLGSFISIGNIFPSTWDWGAFWQLTAFISIILAIMNILPIPALDGGYALLLIYEMITRRKPSDKFMERAVTIGWLFLLALLVIAMWNDLTKFVF